VTYRHGELLRGVLAVCLDRPRRPHAWPCLGIRARLQLACAPPHASPVWYAWCWYAWCWYAWCEFRCQPVC